MEENSAIRILRPGVTVKLLTYVQVYWKEMLGSVVMDDYVVDSCTL
jgi:hypothetical protein